MSESSEDAQKAAPAEGEMEEGEDPVEKSLEMYRRIMEGDGLSEEQAAGLEEKIRTIKAREIIEVDTPHDAKEIPFEGGKIAIGPPILTRFEKARIMGARALQLSLGAPPFIDIPEYAHTSLQIAMEELERHVIPIVIRRVLPNGDFQNINIEDFK